MDDREQAVRPSIDPQRSEPMERLLGALRGRSMRYPMQMRPRERHTPPRPPGPGLQRHARRRWNATLLALACTVALIGPGVAVRADTADEARSSGEGRAPETFDLLMARFAASKGVRARFQETRTLALLAEPIETRGTLYFSPPDRLARVTTYPGHSRVVVRGTRVGFTDETGHREVDLADSELARALVGNLAVLLRGDLVEVRKRYHVDYHAADARWVLVLQPRNRALKAVIERMRVQGTDGDLTSIETLDTNGDATVTRLLEVESGLDLSGDDVFSLEPSGVAE